MSYFEKIGNTISSKSRELVSKAKAVSETSSLNNIIKAEQQKIDTNYKMMGMIYFEKYGNTPSEEFKESINAVKMSMKKIEETQEQINKIRSRNCCPGCGEHFKSDAVFCSKCGARVREESPVPNVVKCPKCGVKLEKGALFCDRCGTKAVEVSETVQVPAAPEPASVEIPPQLPVEENVQAETESEPSKESAAPENERKCPSCGELQEDPDAIYCNSCGTKL